MFGVFWAKSTFMMQKSTRCVLWLLVAIAVTVTSVACSGTHEGGGVSATSNDSSSHHKTTHDSNSSHHGEHHGVHVASINFEYVKSPLIVSLFMIAVVLCKLVFHKITLLSNYVPESCVLIILGTAVGGILHAAQIDTSYFYYIHPETFFLFLLPPCILEASYNLHNVVFFQNLGTILIYAVIGTVINCFIIGPALYGLALAGALGDLSLSFVQCLVFSSLIVAVDPVAVLAIFQEIGVNNVLYFLVFGESLLNDAVTVVLYNTMKTLCTMDEIPVSEIGLAFAAFFTVSLGGLSIGIVFGLITSFVTRFTEHVRVVEPLEMFAMAYASYLTAECFHFSGIISMIGCGLIQKHYAWNNISQHSAVTVEYFIKMLSTTCDSIIFLFLGIALVRDDHRWNTGLVLLSILLCLVVRFLVTIALTVFANYTYRERKVDRQETFIMSYGGLRGAVCFCLVASLDVAEIPPKYYFQTAVFANILFTVFIQGITIKPLVNKLHVMLQPKEVTSLYQEINNHVADHALVAVEDIIGHVGENRVKEAIVHLDEVLNRILLRCPLTHDQRLMLLYQEIAMQQYEEIVYGDEAEIENELYPANDYLKKPSSQPVEMRNKPEKVGGKITKLWRRSMNRTLSGPPVFDGSSKEQELKSLSELLKKASTLNAFGKKMDRNLKNCDETELCHHLHEKQLRHERCLRSQSVFSDSVPGSRRQSFQKGQSGSMGDLKVRDKEFQRESSPTKQALADRSLSFEATPTRGRPGDFLEPLGGTRRRLKSVGARQEVSNANMASRDTKLHGIFVRGRDRRLNTNVRRCTVIDDRSVENEPSGPSPSKKLVKTSTFDGSGLRSGDVEKTNPRITVSADDITEDRGEEVTMLLGSDTATKPDVQVRYAKLHHQDGMDNGDGLRS